MISKVRSLDARPPEERRGKLFLPVLIDVVIEFPGASIVTAWPAVFSGLINDPVLIIVRSGDTRLSVRPRTKQPSQRKLLPVPALSRIHPPNVDGSIAVLSIKQGGEQVDGSTLNTRVGFVPAGKLQRQPVFGSKRLVVRSLQEIALQNDLHHVIKRDVVVRKQGSIPSRIGKPVNTELSVNHQVAAEQTPQADITGNSHPVVLKPLAGIACARHRLNHPQVRVVSIRPEQTSPAQGKWMYKRQRLSPPDVRASHIHRTGWDDVHLTSAFIEVTVVVPIEDAWIREVPAVVTLVEHDDRPATGRLPKLFDFTGFSEPPGDDSIVRTGCSVFDAPLVEPPVQHVGQNPAVLRIGRRTKVFLQMLKRSRATHEVARTGNRIQSPHQIHFCRGEAH